MIEQCIDFQPPINQLFGLANGSFEPGTFREKCGRFATFEADSSTDDLWRFKLGSAALMVCLQTEFTEEKKPNGWPKHRLRSVSRAVLSLCWWESFEKSWHPNHESWQSERNQFDKCYSDSLASAMEVIGSPWIEGTDTTANCHRYAIWRGKTGLLVLQQSAYDPQFGLDVNYWVQPWAGLDPKPTSPFIDWLCKLSDGGGGREGS